MKVYLYLLLFLLWSETQSTIKKMVFNIMF